MKRSAEELLAAYPAITANMGKDRGGSRTTDPMDVPRAIAEIAAMPAGKRPLRRAVHPGNKPQLAVNEANKKAQIDWLGGGGYGPWIKAVHD